MIKMLVIASLVLFGTISNAGTREININENAVIFESGVDADSVDVAISKLTELENKGVNPIYFVVNSPGGSVLAGATLVTHIKNSKSKVITVCRQICASMGFHILQAGKERLTYENAVIMSHPAAGGMQGTLPEMRTQLTVFEQLVESLDRAAASRIGVDYKTWATRNLENIWYTGSDALKNNVVDGLAIVRYSETNKVIFVEDSGADESYNELGVQVYSIR